MPTRTELIPCVVCGKERPVKVRKEIDRTNAAQRMCRSCASLSHPPRPRFEPYATDVQCPQCGIPRTLNIRKPWDRKRVLKQICIRCAALNAANPDPDEMAIERLLAGQPVKAAPSERRAAIAYLTHRKVTARLIAERIGCTPRTVERHRARMAS